MPIAAIPRKLSKMLKHYFGRARGSKSVSYLHRSPLAPPQPPPCRRQEWSTSGCFRGTAPTRPGDPRTKPPGQIEFGPTRTGANRAGAEHRRRSPHPEEDIHEVRGRFSYDGVLPQSVSKATKHTGSSRTHTHEHRSQWREALGSRGRTDRRTSSRRRSTKLYGNSRQAMPSSPSVVRRDWSPVSPNKARGYCCRTPGGH
jgi:hypothetical protein